MKHKSGTQQPKGVPAPQLPQQRQSPSRIVILAIPPKTAAYCQGTTTAFQQCNSYNLMDSLSYLICLQTMLKNIKSRNLQHNICICRERDSRDCQQAFQQFWKTCAMHDCLAPPMKPAVNTVTGQMSSLYLIIQSKEFLLFPADLNWVYGHLLQCLPSWCRFYPWSGQHGESCPERKDTAIPASPKNSKNLTQVLGKLPTIVSALPWNLDRLKYWTWFCIHVDEFRLRFGR